MYPSNSNSKSNYYYSMIKLSFRIKYPFSKPAKEITSPGTKNYKAALVEAYQTEKTKTSKHSVIMIHQWWGLNKSICDTADIFAKTAGFRVIVPDLYKRNPAGDAKEAEHCMNSLDWENALKDIASVQKQLLSESQKVSIMGFCMGGALTFASVSKIQGWHSASPFYGIPDLNTFKIQTMKSPILAHFGQKDQMKGFSDKQSALNLEKQAKQKNVQIKVKIWPNVGHAFCNQNSENFDQATRDSAFEITANFFKK